MFFLAFYYYGAYFLSFIIFWHIFSKILHRLLGPTFERNISNTIRRQKTADYLIKFGCAFNSPYRKYFEDKDPQTFKKYSFFINKLIAYVGTSLCYLVNFIPRMFNEDKSNPIALVLFILLLSFF
jgi:hypothetical protein